MAKTLTRDDLLKAVALVLAQGDLEEAKKRYQEVRALWPKLVASRKPASPKPSRAPAGKKPKKTRRKVSYL